MPEPEPRRTFLVECYAPDISRSDVEAVGRRAAAAAAQLRDEGQSINYVRALFVPADDAVFHVFSADAIDTVREAGERAAIAFERVVESVAVEAEPDPRVPTGSYRGSTARHAEQPIAAFTEE